MINSATFEINKTYEGTGYYGDAKITILSKTEKPVVASTSFGNKRIKLRKDGNGEWISFKAWLFRPTDIV